MSFCPWPNRGPTGFFPLLAGCQLSVQLHAALRGTSLAIDVSLLAMTDITGAFVKSFAEQSERYSMAVAGGVLSATDCAFHRFDCLTYILTET